MNRMIVVASLAAVLASGAVLAAGTQSPPAVQHKTHHHKAGAAARLEFKRLDINKDGYIEGSEAHADQALSRDFATLAKHGKLSRASFVAWKHHQAARAHPATAMQKKPAGDSDK